ncbi:hypothetical protein [Lentzea sp. NEAU-D7]|uniref:hypothetical protein n=1 Tax=Lentzea sp. NEAU-D7 TaxID=2994667 RepID=UPI00224A9AEE|nr:hypothetical protein [Lentzea sp. NEAU-D7]MCX2954727.1 hypothetical protein [Lentzea sp. NEAU-D7]
MQYEVAVRQASTPSPDRSWPTAPLALLAIVLGAIVAWQIRDWSSYLDVSSRWLPVLTAGAGHHSEAEGTLTPPPAIVANAVPNFVGITLLAAHATMASLLLAVVASRRWAARRITALLVFAATSAVLSASVTIPLAGLTVGNAIAPGNTMSAAITVLQYSFVLSLLAAVTLHLRRSP